MYVVLVQINALSRKLAIVQIKALSRIFVEETETVVIIGDQRTAKT